MLSCEKVLERRERSSCGETVHLRDLSGVVNPYPIIVSVAAIGFVAGAVAEMQRLVERPQGVRDGWRQLAYGMFRSYRDEYTRLGWRLVLLQRASFLITMLLILCFFVASFVLGH